MEKTGTTRKFRQSEDMKKDHLIDHKKFKLDEAFQHSMSMPVTEESTTTKVVSMFQH